MRKNKILVYGTGAVGGYFGGRLALNENNDVFFVARSNLGTLKSKGLIAKSVHGDFKTKIQVTSDPGKLRKKFDFILVSVKSFDTDTVIKNIKNLVGEKTLILSLQNGIANYTKLVKNFGKKKVVKGFCQIATEYTPRDIISHTGLGSVYIGDSSGRTTRQVKKVYEILSESEIDVNISRDIDHDVWSKFTWNSIYNILSVITGLTVDRILAKPETEQLCRDIFKEISKLAKIYGVKFTKEDEYTIIDVTKNRGFIKPSTLQDRLKDKRLEYEIFTGDILKMARKAKVPVPINETLYSLLKALDN